MKMCEMKRKQKIKRSSVEKRQKGPKVSEMFKQNQWPTSESGFEPELLCQLHYDVISARIQEQPDFCISISITA